LSLIEAAFRGGAVVLLILVAILLLRDARRVPAGVFSALFALGAACYTIVSDSTLAFEPSPWLWPVRVIAMGNPVVFWLFAASLFDDDFRPSWLHALACRSYAGSAAHWGWPAMSSVSGMCWRDVQPILSRSAGDCEPCS